MRTRALAWGLLALGAGRAPAQHRPEFTLRGDVLMAWVHADTGFARPSLRGTALGGEGRVSVDTWLVGVGLLEGQLRPAGGNGAQSDLVQATLFVGVRPLPWLEMTAGPVIRAYVTDTTSERWVFWQGRARVDAPIVEGSLATYLELWRALSSTVNLPSAPIRAQGGEAGLVYQPPQQPFWLRLAYRLDDAQLGGPSGRETLETIALSLGLALR